MIARLLAFLAAVTVALIAVPAPAGALPFLPQCADGVVSKSPPTPAMPGQGVPGFFDRVDYHHDGTTVYDQYGYAGLTWNTYDLGCVSDAHAIFDTAMGDAMMGVAVTGVAIANALHQAVSHLGFLDLLNPLLTQGSHAVRDAVFNPWIGLSLLLLAVTLLWAARKQNFPAAVTALGWALLVMALATAAIGYPIRAAGMADDITSSSVGLVNQSVLHDKTAGDPAAARASLIVNDVLYRNWLRGEFGNPDSHTAKVYGRALLDAQAYTWGQAARIAKDPGAAAGITKGKNTAWTHLTGKIQQQDPGAYWHITGHALGRWGAGGLALLATLLVLAFLIAADLIVVVALLLFRLGLILIPLTAPIAIHSPPVLRRVIDTMIGGLVSAVLFAFGAALQLINIRVVLGGHGLPEWLALLLCGVISFVLWRILRSLWHVTRVMHRGFDPGGDAAKSISDGRKRIGKWIGSATSAYAGSRAGTEAGVEHAMATAGETPRPESWTRPAAPYRYVPEPASAGPAAGPGTPSNPPAAARGIPPASPPPAGPAPDPPAVDSGETIMPADAPLPEGTIRADAVLDENGNLVHRIWTAGDDGTAPGSYETYTEREGAGP